MDNLVIPVGKVIKELRNSLNISQKELSKGICSQAQISHIENGETPYSDTLYKLANRLGVDMNYFFDVAVTPRLDYVQNSFQLIRSYVRNYRYEELEEVVNAELKNPLFKKPRHRQFLLWHKGMALYYLNNDVDLALRTLKEALYLESNLFITEQQLEIMTTIGNIYNEIKDYNQAIGTYRECENMIKNHLQKVNPTIEIKLLYNYTMVLSKALRDDEAIPVCEKGIAWCKKEREFSFFGQLYYQLGWSYWKTERHLDGIECMEKAYTILELIDNTKNLEKIKNMINEIEVDYIKTDPMV